MQTIKLHANSITRFCGLAISYSSSPLPQTWPTLKSSLETRIAEINQPASVANRCGGGLRTERVSTNETNM